MRTKTLAGLLTLMGVLLLATSVLGAAAQIAPRPLGKKVNAGEDTLSTPFGGTGVEYPPTSPLAAGTLGIDMDAFVGYIDMYGDPIINSLGLPWNTDTIIRRLQATPKLAIGDCADVDIEFIALNLQSWPFTVSYSNGAYTKDWTVKTGLSLLQPQPLGYMTICRTHVNGGTFDAYLNAIFKMVFTEVADPTNVITLDLGATGETTQFVSQNNLWAYNLLPNLDKTEPGMLVDRDGDGIVDPGAMWGGANFQPTVNPLGGGGGGGGEDPCAKAEHVSGGGQDHSRPSHRNYAAGGDGDGNGTPDECECDDGSEPPCEDEEEEEPIEHDAQLID